MINLLSTRVDLSFAAHKLEKFSANPGKVYFEGLVHLLSYISKNKTLGLKCHADMSDAPLSDLFIEARINNDNQLMDFYDYNWQDCPDTGRTTGACIIFYQYGPIYHGIHVPVPFSQSSA